MRLTEVARAAGLPVPTAQRILAVLERHSYVTQDKSGYGMGVTPLVNAHAYLTANPLAQVVGPVLRDLAEATRLTASVSVRVALHRVMVARIDGPTPLRYQLPVGERLPIHTGVGRVFATWLGPDELGQLIEQVVPFKLADGRPVDEAAFRRSLLEIRELGYAMTESERELGAASVGVPVFTGGGELAALLQIAGHAESVDVRQIERYVSELQGAAMTINRLLP